MNWLPFCGAASASFVASAISIALNTIFKKQRDNLQKEYCFATKYVKPLVLIVGFCVLMLHEVSKTKPFNVFIMLYSYVLSSTKGLALQSKTSRNIERKQTFFKQNKSTKLVIIIRNRFLFHFNFNRVWHHERCWNLIFYSNFRRWLIVFWILLWIVCLVGAFHAPHIYVLNHFVNNNAIWIVFADFALILPLLASRCFPWLVNQIAREMFQLGTILADVVASWISLLAERNRAVDTIILIVKCWSR